MMTRKVAGDSHTNGPIREPKMTKRTIGYLASGVMSCGVLGLWATFSLRGVAADRVVGTLAIVAFVLALIALRRRSWTRLPLVASCWFAYVLVWVAYIGPDDPMAIEGLAYAFDNALLVMAAAVTLVIVKHDQRS